ncbi:MAG: cyclic nucleotide-binding domain-containing protein [Candidatus Sumerlaeia bacterium]|nr:cyclic nucleotide-binding domain-containing protein [Candidatus Sumerlaeia bacterium]
MRKKTTEGTVCTDLLTELIGELAHIPLFTKLPPEALEKIASLTIMVPIYKGQTIHEEGDPGTDLVFLASGGARVQVESIYPPLEVGIYRARRGDLLGENPLLTSGFHCATVVCIESGSILKIREEKLRELFDRKPRWGYLFMEALAHDLALRSQSLSRRLVNRVRADHIHPLQ